ncbi:MAG: hypothetical protein ACK547_00415, partial [Alphaproteobacteria bacterium]
DGDPARNAEAMLQELLTDHATLIATAKAASDGADDVTAAVIDARVDAHQKHAWMIRAPLGYGVGSSWCSPSVAHLARSESLLPGTGCRRLLVGLNPTVKNDPERNLEASAYPHLQMSARARWTFKRKLRHACRFLLSKAYGSG